MGAQVAERGLGLVGPVPGRFESLGNPRRHPHQDQRLITGLRGEACLDQLAELASDLAAERPQHRECEVALEYVVAGGFAELLGRRQDVEQVIDDLEGKTLASASSLEKDVRGAIDGMNKTDVAKKVGTLLGERAKKAGVSKVSFDRGTYKYHGRVKALADGARQAGLEF